MYIVSHPVVIIAIYDRLVITENKCEKKLSIVLVYG